MKQLLDRNSAEYARAVEKVYSLQPAVRRIDHDHFEVTGSEGTVYSVFLNDDGAFGCDHRYAHGTCYHVVAADIHRREALARFEAEVGCKSFLPGARTLGAIRMRELEAHRAGCDKCRAGEECRRVGKLLERMGSLARAIAQAA